jgi:hypothetical protein
VCGRARCGCASGSGSGLTNAHYHTVVRQHVKPRPQGLRSSSNIHL